MQTCAAVQAVPSMMAAPLQVAPGTAVVQPLSSERAVELGGVTLLASPSAAGTSARVRAARKSEPAGGIAAAAQSPLAANAAAHPPLGIRSSLGQRGGVVKKSDGFEVFYGLVGDQPEATCGPTTIGTAAAQTSAVGNSPVQKTSMRPVLGKRGGVVRKSDGFEVFYGLVGDQPAEKSTAKDAPEAGGEEEQRAPQDAGAEAPEASATTEPREGEAKQDGGDCRSPSKVAPDLAAFSLAPPATSFAPGRGGSSAPGMASAAANKLAGGDLNRRLAAQLPKATIAEYSLATPATSFSPSKKVSEQDEDPEADYWGDINDFPADLGTMDGEPTEDDIKSLAARLQAMAHTPAEIYSLATPATSLAHRQAIPTLDISNVAARDPKSTWPAETGNGRGTGWWSISSAGFPDFFGTGQRLGGSALQSRLDGIDGAIAKLRALQSS